MKPVYALYALCLFLMSFVPSTVFADSDVRDFEGLAYVPNNTVAMFGYFRHTSSNYTKAMAENSTSQELGGLRGTYILHYGGLAIVPIDVSVFALDYSLYTGGPAGTLHGSGLTDPEYFPTIAYVVQEGSPASQMHTVFAFNPRVTIPIGTYDTNALINAGANRVTFKPQVSIAQRFAKVFTAEIVGNIAIHTSNSKFVIPNPAPMGMGLVTTKMAQDSDLYIDAHLGADLSKDAFLGLSYYYAKVGAQKLTDLGNHVATDKGSVSSIRISFGIHIEKNTTLLLQLDQNFAASGTAAIDRFAGIRISHVFFDMPEPAVVEPRREAPEPPPVQNPTPDSPTTTSEPAPAAAEDAPM